MRPARASAPVRLDFAGGWTDVPPFSAREGGAVVSAAITLRAEAEVLPGGVGLRLVSEDLGERLELAGPDGLADGEKLVLLRTALRMASPSGPLTLRTRCAAPAGSGLGASGAIDVALMAALAASRGETPANRELAERGWRLEAVEAKIPGGKQDQFAAAFGGINLFRFRDPAVEVERIRLAPAFADELARRTVLCYTGASRFSGGTIVRVMAAYERGDSVVLRALRRIRCAAEEMADALRAEDLARVGALLADNWCQQQALDPGMSTPAMSRLEVALRAAGALGGKAAGAGAGGCMFFVAGDDVPAARRAAVEAGAQLLEVAWAAEGVRAW